jgi:hypothetical protein
VEFINAKGNTAGPEPAWNYTAPRMWEFYFAVPSVHPELFLFPGVVSSSFGGEAVFADTWRPYGTNRIYTSDNDVGNLLWTMADETNSFAPVFSVDRHRKNTRWVS